MDYLESYLNQERHFKCHRYPCIFYQTLSIMHGSHVQYLNVEGLEGSYPIVMVKTKGNTLIFSMLEPFMLDHEVQAILTAHSDNKTIHLKGTIKPDNNNQVIFKDFKGYMYDLSSHTRKTLEYK